MKKRICLALALATAAPYPTLLQAAEPTPLQVSEGDAKCVVAGEYPKIEGTVQPISSVRTIHLYFKSALGSSWYYVDGKIVDGVIVSTTPKPNLNSGPLSFYFEVIGADGSVTRGADWNARVVGS